MHDLAKGPEIDLGSFLCNRFGDHYLYAVNRNAFNQTGAETVLNSRFGDELYLEDTLYVLAGSDSGLLIEHIRKQGVPNGTRYVFVELPEIIERLWTRFQPEDLGDRISICEPERAREHIYACNFSVYAHLDQIQIVRSLAVEDGFITAYRDLCRMISDWMDRERWKFRAGFYSPGFIARQMQNVAENREPASVFRDQFNGHTAVILGGGPSLDEMLPWVREHRDSVCVFAVSRICRQLLQEGVRPDIISAIDPYPISFDVSREMLNFWEDSIFATSNHVLPNLLASWKGRSVYLDDRLPWPNDLDKEPNIPGAGPTVTNSAISLAMHMGFDQIVLGGVDLCFNPEGFSHASGSNESQAGPLVAFLGHSVKTNGDGEAETDTPLRNAIKEMAKQARSARKLNCEIVNPAVNAASVKGVTHKTLGEIEYLSLPRPAREMLSDLLPEDSSETRRNHYQTSLQEVRRALHKLTKVRDMTTEALDHVDKLFAADDKKDFKHKIRMDRIEKQLNRKFEAFGKLCKLFGMREFVRIIRPDEDSEWTDQELEESSRAYYQAYQLGSQRLVDLFRETVDRLESRLEEEQAEPDMACLINQWKSDATPGRALVWEHFNSEIHASLPEDIREQLTSLVERFHETMTKVETGHTEYCHDSAKLRGAESKALEFFRNFDQDGLQRLVKGLSLRNEPEAGILKNLALGMLAELQNDTETAILAYQEVDQLPYLELALTRIAGIALDADDFDSSLVALELLAQISSNYMPHYADLLRITGDTQGALDIYTAYLPMVPDDLATMTRLGILYRELGVAEGAEWVFRHILEGDPQNKVAQSQLQEMESAV